MSAVVIDTNVVVTANGRDTTTDVECQLACVRALLEAQAETVVVLDDGGRILAEYRRYCSYSGQPGVGDRFFLWLHQNQGVAERVECVPITEYEPDRFNEFPNDPALSTLDPSDRKFVAVAIASHLRPPILFAVERGWWWHEVALNANGVVVRSLCPQHRPLDATKE